MIIYKNIFAILIFSVIALGYAEEIDFTCKIKNIKPLFYCSFDKGKTNSMLLIQNSLQLTKGISGQSARIGAEKGKDFNATFNNSNVVNPEQGTVSFWIKPENWNGKDEKNHHVFFAAKNKEQRILIYKYIKSNKLWFLWQDFKNKKNYKSVADISSWQKGHWHFITCTWNKEHICLYIDGILKDRVNINILRKPFKQFAIGGFSPWTQNSTSFIDEFKLYDVPLKAQYIYKQWVDTVVNKYKSADTNYIITIGQTSKAPAVDGKIVDNEYSYEGTGFIDLTTHLLAPTQSKYYLTYDDKNIYFAVKTPVLKSHSANITGRDSNVWENDSIELYLQPPKHRQYYQFIFNSAGGIYDSKGSYVTWNCDDLKIHNSIQGGNWIFEASIPFKQLGIDKPKNGDQWGLNVARTFCTDEKYTCISPVKGKSYGEKSNFFKLVLEKNAPVVSLGTFAGLLRGTSNLNIKTENFAPSTIPLLFDCNILDNANPIVNFKRTESISPESHAVIKVPATQINGLASMTLCIISGKNKLFNASYQWQVQNPDSCKIVAKYILPKKKLLVLEIHQDKLSNKGKSLKIAVSLLNSQNKQVYHKITAPDSSKYKINIPLTGIKPGSYTAQVKVINDKNQELAKAQVPFINLPDAPWLGCLTGISKKVPAPWTPIQTGKDSIRCWGRKYSFGNSLLPEQIYSQGSPLLATPVKLYSVIDGKECKVSGTKLRWLQKEDGKVHFETSGKLGRIRIANSYVFEFDGYLWVDMDLKTDVPVKIDKLELEIPLKRENASLIDQAFHIIMAGSGKLSDKHETYVNLARKPDFWVGNEDTGLQWFAEDINNWSVKDKAKCAKIIPEPNSKKILVTFVNKPMTLNGSKRISFGLMATPVKPIPKDIRSWKIASNYRSEGNICFWMVLFKTNYPDLSDYYKNYEKFVEISLKSGKRQCFYNSFEIAEATSPEWQYNAEQWMRKPQSREPSLHNINSKIKEYLLGFCPNSSDYRDFFMWKLDQVLPKYKYKLGMYFDFARPRRCINKNHGCGKFGGYTYQVRGARELAKRVYIYMRQHYPDQLIIHHISGSLSPAMHSFADILTDGETLNRSLQTDLSYYKILPLDLYRAHFMLHPQGLVQAFLPQFTQTFFLQSAKNNRNYWKTTKGKAAIDHLKGMILIHDTKFWPGYGINMKDIRKIQYSFGWDDKTLFIPYWKNNEYISINPENPNIVASLFKRPGKVMVIPFNNTDKDTELTIKINSHKLGLYQGAEATKAMGDSSISYKNNTLKLFLKKRSFSIIILK